MRTKSITKEQAIAKAKEVAKRAYRNIDMFEVTTKEDSSYWMVSFTNPRALARGEVQHFAVWINKQTGKARLFRGR